MEFKIETKDAYCLITPDANEINAKLTDRLSIECDKLRQNGSNCFIVDFQAAKTMSANAVPGLLSLHESIYSSEGSLVFTGLQPRALSQLKEDETDLLLNIAPKMIEAIDIISMEILERDIMGEE